MKKALVAAALLADLALEVWLYRNYHLLQGLYLDPATTEDRRGPLGFVYRNARPRRGLL